jgi:hypothetical protein
MALRNPSPAPKAKHGCIFILCCAGILISISIGCSFWSRTEAVDRDAEIEDFTSQGGFPSPGYAASSIHETWLHEDVAVSVSIRIPHTPGQLPVAVYLPGLGEVTDHGQLWKSAWERAGYIAVSIQPKEYGEALAPTGKLNPLEYKTIGRKPFSHHALENRIS